MNNSYFSCIWEVELKIMDLSMILIIWDGSVCALWVLNSMNYVEMT